MEDAIALLFVIVAAVVAMLTAPPGANKARWVLAESAIALLIVVLASVLALVITPADPLTYYIASTAISILALAAYYARRWRNRKRTAGEGT